MPFRLLLYMVEIWREVYNNTPQNERESKHFRLPAIIPLVLYNGRPRWTAATYFQDVLAGSEQFAGYLLNFHYEVISVQGYNDRVLMNMANLVAAVFMLDKSRDWPQIIKTLHRLQRVLQKMTPDDFQRFKTFCLKIFAPQLSPEKQQEISAAIEKLGPEESDRMVTNIERILGETINNARQEGIAQGKLENALAALREGLDPQLVSKITGLSLKDVLELQKKTLH